MYKTIGMFYLSALVSPNSSGVENTKKTPLSVSVKSRQILTFSLHDTPSEPPIRDHVIHTIVLMLSV
jgi:hypothetical protein